jgi:glycosyltransferase involved in cell wall biosynthesis
MQNTIAERDSKITDFQQLIQRNELDLTQMQNTIAERDSKITDFQQLIQRNELVLTQMHSKVADRDLQLVHIYSSFSWKTILKFRKYIGIVAPSQSKRRRVYELSKKGFITIYRDGWKIAFIKTYKRLWKSKTHQSSMSAISEVNLNIVVDNGKEQDKKGLISIIVALREADCLDVYLKEVLEQLNKQTIKQWELVVRISDDECLLISGETSERRNIDISNGLLDICNGSIIYSPTFDLKHLPVNWLEVNLISIESQKLLLTCNSFEVENEKRTLNIEIQNSTVEKSDLLFYRRELASIKDCQFLPKALMSLSETAAEFAFGRIILWVGYSSKYKTISKNLIEIFNIQPGSIINVDNYLSFNNNLLNRTLKINPVDLLLQPIKVKLAKPVLFIHLPFLAIGGAEKLTFDLLKEISDVYSLVLFTTDGYAPNTGVMTQDFRDLGVIVYDCMESLVPQLAFSMFSYLVRKYEPLTLFVANGSNFFYENLESIKLCFPNLKIVNQIFDHEAGWINRYSEPSIKLIDAHVACNDKIENTYFKKYKLPSDKIYKIEHGIDLNEFTECLHDIETKIEVKKVGRIKFNIPTDKILVCFIGRLHPQKRPNDFIKLAKRFENNDRYFFMMVGDGQLRDNVEDFLELYDLKNFKKIGFYSPILDIFQIIDILVITSEYEGLPIVVLNALAMSVAVVSTDVGSVKEVLGRDDAGLVVNIGDIDSLSKGINQATDSLETYRNRGRITVEKNHDIKNISKKYLEVFKFN